MKKFEHEPNKKRKEFTVELKPSKNGRSIERRAYAPFQPRGKVYDRKGKR